MIMSYQLKRISQSLIALSISIIVSQPTLADTVSSLDQALEKVSQYQGQTELSKQRKEIAELNVQQSKLWKNPTITIDQSGFKGSQDRELSFGVSQPLDIFGERRVDRKIATIAAQKNDLQQNLINSQSSLIVKFAWSQLALSNAEYQIYSSQLQVSKNTLDSAKKRYQAGSIALVDYERLQIEALEIQRLYEQSKLNLQVAKRQLSNLWGESETEIKLSQSEMIWPTQTPEHVQRIIAEGQLEKLYALNIEQSNQQIEQLKVRAKPNPNINFGMKNTRTPDQRTDTSLSFGVQIPLNIFNRQQYRIPMVQRQQALLNQQQQRELKQQILDIANSLYQLKGLDSQFKASSQQVALSEKVQQRTLQGYQAGKFSTTDIQQTSQQLQTIRLGQLQILKQAWQSALNAEALSIGSSYEQISSSNAFTQLNKQAIEQSQNIINLGDQ